MTFLAFLVFLVVPRSFSKEFAGPSGIETDAVAIFDTTWQRQDKTSLHSNSELGDDGHCISDDLIHTKYKTLDENKEAFERRWVKYEGKYLEGYCSSQPYYDTLKEAQTAFSNTNPSNECGGITYEKNRNRYTLRQSNRLAKSPSGEISWLPKNEHDDKTEREKAEKERIEHENAEKETSKRKKAKKENTQHKKAERERAEKGGRERPKKEQEKSGRQKDHESKRENTGEDISEEKSKCRWRILPRTKLNIGLVGGILKGLNLEEAKILCLKSDACQGVTCTSLDSCMLSSCTRKGRKFNDRFTSYVPVSCGTGEWGEEDRDSLYSVWKEALGGFRACFKAKFEMFFGIKDD
ncbi:hypothetical protein ACHWQZ_G018654 [Mnemiopsis leidyi]